MDMAPEGQALIEALSKTLAYHNRWGSFDFIFIQTILWLAIIASVLSTVFASLQNVSKWLTVPIAVIPALVLSIEATFNFSDRVLWHDEYSTGIDRMMRSLTVNHAIPQDVNKQ